ncbi:hypothetical protein [Bacillus sp. FJAT-50079]|uniref:hypothetical protein n=1 Tax=Bacillus sp. FJAT-50079 TaxID=2833577 RepID=UPI001BCA5900|nr:hypothetical protein [Bacillus sp. FJAT-50079]MBS4210375.1 hypothetical protein [Bacillus sp. FJAT-50079]
METDKLMRKATKYKKWLEHYTLNPFAYEVNNRKYYLVFYHGNKPENVKGHAVISLDDGPKEEYKQALLPLTIMVGSSNQIFNKTGQRSLINPEFFSDTIQVVEAFTNETADKVLMEGLALFKEVKQLHVRFIDLYKNYENYYDNTILKRNIITDDDIDYTNEVLAKLAILQYEQGKIISEKFDLLSSFYEALKTYNLDKQIPKQSWDFIRGMLGSKKELARTLQDLTFEKGIFHLPEEEQIKVIEKELYRINEQMLADRRNNLRGFASQYIS